MCIYNVYESVWHASLWNKRLYELCPRYIVLAIRKILGKWGIVHKSVFYFYRFHFRVSHVYAAIQMN
jgi:hypothetical protein